MICMVFLCVFFVKSLLSNICNDCTRSCACWDISFPLAFWSYRVRPLLCLLVYKPIVMIFHHWFMMLSNLGYFCLLSNSTTVKFLGLLFNCCSHIPHSSTPQFLSDFSVAIFIWPSSVAKVTLHSPRRWESCAKKWRSSLELERDGFDVTKKTWECTGNVQFIFEYLW